MNPDQTAPKEAVWYGSMLFEILATKHKADERSRRKQM